MPTKQYYGNVLTNSCYTTASALSTDTSLTVNSTTNLPSGQFTAIISGEFVLATVSDSTHVAIVRAQEGTTAGAIASGQYLIPILTVASLCALVRESKNGTSVAARRELNFIEGNSVALTLADNSGNEACDITINVALVLSSGPPSGSKPDGTIAFNSTDKKLAVCFGGTWYQTAALT